MRLRFAPSPTGYLHVGGARTALFNWLLARGAGGTFLIRIEDTDRERSSESMIDAILEGMRWLGLDWDGDPVFQSAGVERHRADALRLLAEGKAYRDFTLPEELRAEAAERGIGHPSILAREKADALGVEEAELRAAAGVPHAIRLRVPEGRTGWDDLVHGAMSFENADLDDLVILRSDGSPIYNLAVVSDDAAMGITDVLRGDDHLSNTPKQILLYEALGLPVPRFGHLPMILGPDGRRLSKRHGATAIGEYRAQGILPDTMVNFLALLGWSPGGDRERMERRELLELFSLERVHRKSAVFDPAKLEWLNGVHIAATPDRRLLEEIDAHLEEPQAAGEGESRSRLRGEEEERTALALVALLKGRARTLDALAELFGDLLREPVVYDPDVVRKRWADPVVAEERLARLRTLFAEGEWGAGPLEERLRKSAEEGGIKAGELIHPLRLALTGQGVSPGIFELMEAFGRERVLRRIDAARSHLVSLREGEEER